MTIAAEILTTLPRGTLVEVRVGVHWTAVVVEADGQLRCGLASTLADDGPHGGEPAIPAPGSLEQMPAEDLAAWIGSPIAPRRSLGAAAVNALLRAPPPPWQELNASEVIARFGEGRSVALVGHFPFVDELRARVGRLWVLERRPHPGDEPEDAAPRLLPQAEVVAITGATFVNGTLDGLLHLCRPGARVVVLGPSTPLSPVLFEHGVDVLSGAIVERREVVVRAASQGAGFRQMHKLGVRLVALTRPGVAIPPAVQL